MQKKPQEKLTIEFPSIGIYVFKKVERYFADII